MKIKVTPYPDYTITDEAFDRDVIPKSVSNVPNPPLSGHLIMIVDHPDGTKSFNSARPIPVGNRKYISPFPSPQHLYMSLAVEHFEISEKIKSINFPECGKQYTEEVFLLDAEPGSTHECFTKYFKYRIGSVILLVSALEAFMNHIIPNSFVYCRERKKGGTEELRKNDIESTKVSFKEKLNLVVPAALAKPSFWEGWENDRDFILELYGLRTELIHLKTNSQSDLEKYFVQIDKMLDLDIGKAISVSINFMNEAHPGFIKYSHEPA